MYSDGQLVIEPEGLHPSSPSGKARRGPYSPLAALGHALRARRAISSRLPGRSERGVSLLEALAATAVLSIGLLAFAGNSISLTRGLKAADSTAAAAALAVQKLEQLRSMPLGSSGLVTGLYYDSSNPLKADGTSGGPYGRRWVVSSKDTPRLGLKTVTVTVSWTDSKAHETRVAAFVRCSTIPCP